MTFNKNGLVPLRFNEIETLIQDTQKATIAESISYHSSNKIHQLNSVYARSLDQVSQLAEAAFDMLKLGSAEGYHLEEIARLRGVFRLPAKNSNTNSQYAWLQSGAVLPAGSLFSAPSLGSVQAVNTSPVTGSKTSCAAAEAVTTIVSPVASGLTYGWSINGTNYTYETLGGESLVDIQDALKVELDADTGKTFSYTEQVYGTNRSFIFTSDEGVSLSVVPLITRISVARVKVYFYLELIESGSILVTAGEMTQLLSPVVGFLETSNDDDFVLGREQETDSELRLRVQAGNLSDCTGTPDTIVQSLLTNVAGVTYAKVIQNLDYATGFPTDEEGRPWLSYETLVVGGSDAEVAQEIWRTSPANAWTYGNQVNYPVTDSSGEPKFVSFSRPTQVNIIVEVDYVLYDEEIFPDGGDAAIQAVIVTYISNLPIGKDVIAGRLFSVIYGAAAGIGDVVVRIKKSGDPSFTTGTIPIAAREYTITDIGDVTINP